MKRITMIVVAALLLVALVFSLASCGKMVECSICGEEGRESSMKHEELFGVDVYTCKDCQEDLNDIGEGLNDLFG